MDRCLVTSSYFFCCLAFIFNLFMFVCPPPYHFNLEDEILFPEGLIVITGVIVTVFHWCSHNCVH